jgi:hypothetical protein
MVRQSRLSRGISNSKVNDYAISSKIVRRKRVVQLAAAGALLLGSDWAARGQTVSLTAADASGSNSFLNAGNWSNAAVPSSGNAYVDNYYVLRSPTSGNATWAGGTLTLADQGTFLIKETNVTINVGYMTLNAGILGDGLGSGAGYADTLTGTITLSSNGGYIYNNSNNSNSPNITITAPIGGTGALNFGCTNFGGGSETPYYFNAVNTFSGGLNILGGYAAFEKTNAIPNGSTISFGSGVAPAVSTLTPTLDINSGGGFETETVSGISTATYTATSGTGTFITGSNNAYNFGAGSVPAGIKVGQAATAGSTTVYVTTIDTTTGVVGFSGSLGTGSQSIAFNNTSATTAGTFTIENSSPYYGGTLNFAGASNSSTFTGNVTGNNFNLQVSSGSLTVNGASVTYLGATTVGGASSTSLSSLTLSPTSASTFGGTASFAGSAVSVAPNAVDTSTLTLGANTTLNAGQINIGYNGGSTGGTGTLLTSGNINVGTIDLGHGYSAGGTATFAEAGAAIVNVNKSINGPVNNSQAATISLAGTSQLNLLNNSYITWGSYYAPTVTVNIASGSQLGFYGSSTSTYSSTGSFNIAGSGAFTINLSGTLAEPGVTYTGQGATGGETDAINLTGGTLLMTANTLDFFNTTTANGGTAGTNVPNAGAHTVLYPGAGGGTLNTLGNSVTLTDQSGTTTFNVIQHGGTGTDGGITYDDTATTAGTLTIQGNTSYNGPTTVTRGYLIQAGLPLNTDAITVPSGETYVMQQPSGANTLAVLTLSGSGSVIFSGTGAASFSGNGTVAMSGGTINVQSGSVVFGNYTNGLTFTSNKSSLNIGSTAIVDGLDSNPVFDALTGSGTYQSGWYGTRTLTLGANNGSGTFWGTIQGNGIGGGNTALVKEGTGAETLTGTLTLSGNPALQVEGGTSGSSSTLTINPAYALIGSLSNPILIGSNGSDYATLNASGGTFLASTLDVGAGLYGSGGVGTLNASGTAVFDTDQVFTSQNNGNAGTITVSGTAQLNLYNNGTIVFGQYYGRPTTVNQSGGTVAFYSDAGSTLGGTGEVNLQNGTATYNLSGGLLSVPKIVSTGGSLAFTFNGGTLQTTGSSSDFFPTGHATVAVSTSGGTIDTYGNSVTINESLAHAGTATYDGGVTVVNSTGSGSLILGGASTYTGSTNVNSSLLDVTGSIANSGTINVNATNTGATLILDGTNALSSSAPVTGTTTGTALPLITVNSSQNLGAVTNAGTTNFTSGTSTAASFAGTGTLVVASPVTLTVSNSLNHGGIISAGTINVNGGTTNLVGTINDASVGQTSVLNVNTGANLTVAPLGHIVQGVVNIASGSTVTVSSNPNGAFNPTSTLPSPTISVVNDLYNNGSSSSLTSGTLDLKNNALIVNDPNEASSIITAVYNAADFNPSSGSNQWDQAGITSSSAAANAGTYALGSLTGTELTNLGSTTFQGLPVTSNSTVVAYTLIGDTELRGTVDGTDYNNVLANYDTAGDWSQGNFYNESIVSGDDYNAVLNAYDVAASGGAKGLKPAVTRSLSPALSPVATSGTFHLEVNTTSGDVVIFNDSTSSAPLTLYNIVDGSQQDLLIGNPADGNGTSGSIASGTPPYTNEHLLSVAQNDSNAVASITGRSSTNYKAWSLVLDGYNSNATALALSEGGVANKTDTINVPSYYSIDLGDIFNVGTTTVALTFQWGTQTSAGGEGGTVYSNQPIDYIGTPEPASLGLLGLGGLALMRRRRKA